MYSKWLELRALEKNNYSKVHNFFVENAIHSMAETKYDVYI